jgi:hypothetical protein
MKTLQFEMIPARPYHVVMDTTTGRVISESLSHGAATKMTEDLNTAVMRGPNALAIALGATD